MPCTVSPQNFFRQSRNVEKDIFHLCWRDTQCELFVLDEPAPLEEPVEDSLKPAFSALQDRYMIRWKPIVQRAFDANWPNVRNRGETVEIKA